MPHAIPRLIHQMWGTPDVPAPYADYHLRIRALNPDCALRLWTDAGIEAFIHAECPQRLDAYRALPLDVHRWDLARYLILRHHGGLYLDIDIEPTRSFAPLFASGAGLVLFHEHPLDVRRMGRRAIFANAVIGCAPGPSMLDVLIDEICSAPHFDVDTRTAVCEQTGPLLLTAVFDRLRPAATIHDHRAFFPQPNLRAFADLTSSEVGRFGTHRFAGTWWPQVAEGGGRR